MTVKTKAQLLSAITPLVPESWDDGDLTDLIDTIFSLPQVAVADISAAQLASLHSTRVDVIAAPGVGKVIVPIAATFIYEAGAVGYFVDESPLGLQLGDSNSLFTTDMLGFLPPSIGLLQGLDSGMTRFEPMHSSEEANTLYFDTPDAADSPENQALSLNGSRIGAIGPILTASIPVEDGSSDYAPGDTGELVDELFGSEPHGGTGATYEVDAVDGGGAVTAFTITAPGTGWSPAKGSYETNPTSGVGTGFRIKVDTITPQSDGTGRMTVLYHVVELI